MLYNEKPTIAHLPGLREDDIPRMKLETLMRYLFEHDYDSHTVEVLDDDNEPVAYGLAFPLPKSGEVPVIKLDKLILPIPLVKEIVKKFGHWK